MIPREKVDEIIETARVEEVVGEFVTLKKRGANLIGLCPFHNEKTPSFTVSPAKGFYKCFGCGEGGNAVNFVMQHEHYSYPEALRYLASRYQIEIEEEELTPEMQKEQSERESLFVVAAYAETYFVEQLNNTEEGKAVGLSYLKERGFTSEMIEKFKVGYSPNQWNAFTEKALAEGYKEEYLTRSGLSKKGNNGLYDGYKGRIIFPIHNLSGRTVGFGGRILKSNEKAPKYVNSPENEIYNKRALLYGLFQAKQAVVRKDNCYLVEGYTDVVSLHQTGIENVVSSSGTSLTKEQIKLISRYTKNITILYDGDAAGIKASFRGIDLILEEGLNVKVVLFPEGEDPDSYSRQVDQETYQAFLDDNAKDFIVFKTDLLLTEAKNDPIRKTQLVHEIIDSVALIPDFIARSVYLKECSTLLDVPEKALVAELNKVRRRKISKEERKREQSEPIAPEPFRTQQPGPGSSEIEPQERGIIRALLLYGNEEIQAEVLDEEDKVREVPVKLSDFILNELIRDEMKMENPVYQLILDEFIAALDGDNSLTEKHFVHHENEQIRKISVDIISELHELHNWESRDIFVEKEDMKLKKLVKGVIYSYKTKKIVSMIHNNQQKLDEAYAAGTDFMPLLQKQQILMEIKRKLSDQLGRTILN